MNRAHTSVRGPDVLIPGSQRFSRWRRLISWAGGLTSLLLMGAPNLPGQAGSVDPTFAPSPGLGLDFRAMALAPDGSVILASHESDGGIGVTRVRRLDRFGAGDPNFHSPQFDFGGSGRASRLLK
jgi:hypothetical protein